MHHTQSHDLIHYQRFTEPTCTNDYVGETCRRIIKRTADQAGIDKQSHLLKHALTRNHGHVDLGNMKKIIDSSFHNNKLKSDSQF